MDESELLESISGIGILNGRCQLEIENATPAGWQVTIAAGGANFYYADNSSETDGPRPLNLQAGGRVSFYSKKEAGCVKRVLCALKVVVPGEGAHDFVENIDDCPANMCMNYRGVRLAPKNNVSHPQLGSNKIEDLFEIKAF